MIRNFNNKKPFIADSAYVDSTALIIGDVQIADHASIWPMAVIRGDIHRITIGHHSNIQDGSVLHVTHAGEFHPQGSPIIIGNHVIVGHRVVLHGCTIADKCLIGIGSIVMDNVMVEGQVIIGAGSLVPPGKILETGFLWLGNPVKKIRPLTEKEITFLDYSANYYVKLKDQYKSQK